MARPQPLIQEDDVLIKKVTPIKKLPIWLHLYSAPSFIVYLFGIYIWTFLTTSETFMKVSSVLDERHNKTLTESEVELMEDSGLTSLDEGEALSDDLKVVNETAELEDLDKPEPWSLEAQAAVVAIFTSIVLHTLVGLTAVWSVKIRSYMTSLRAKNLDQASHLLVEPTVNNGESEIVELEYDKFNQVKYFVFQKIKYVFDSAEKNVFLPLTVKYEFEGEYPGDLIREKGMHDEGLIHQKALFGSNKMVMEIPPFWELFYERATGVGGGRGF